MPHSRERFILNQIMSKLKFAPVFALQGARQTGKSFLAREIISKKIKRSVYLTFDQKTIRSFATKRPDTFLDNHIDYHPIIIDEAQKVPDIFEAIKYKVDLKRIPGKFFILGSTEFSSLSNIRESLTGRMSRAKLYPLTIRETLSKKSTINNNNFNLMQKPLVSREEFLRYLNHGGLPGIFTVKNQQEKKLLLKDWIALTVERDIHNFNNKSLSSDLAIQILENIAKLKEPNLASLSSEIKVDPRKIKSHIRILEALFVINTLKPHKLGTGKEMYFILDSAIAMALGADFDRLINTTILNELLARSSYFYNEPINLYFYRNSKGSLINFLLEETDGSISLLKTISDEKYDDRNLEILLAFRKKTNKQVNLYALGPHEGLGSREKIKVYPWESIA